MRLLIIDNFDSFTYNLVHYAEPFVDTLHVVRNHAIELNDIDQYDAIILSPGPGLPKDTGISLDVVRTYAKHKKILGVCMGMQIIGEAFGAQLVNLDNPLHGVAIETYQTSVNHEIFQEIPSKFQTGRYHSWVIDPKTLPESLQVTAMDSLGLVQAIRHKEYPVSGVQFHPESILTEFGKQMIKNWIYS